jgi:hypothetical protein
LIPRWLAARARPGKRAHNEAVPFGFGFGDLVLILTVVVVFGATTLPQGSLGADLERFRARQQHAPRLHLLLRRTSFRRWTISNWLLAISAAVAVAAVIANALLLRR